MESAEAYIAELIGNYGARQSSSKVLFGNKLYTSTLLLVETPAMESKEVSAFYHQQTNQLGREQRTFEHAD